MPESYIAQFGLMLMAFFVRVYKQVFDLYNFSPLVSESCVAFQVGLMLMAFLVSIQTGIWAI